MSTEQTEVTAIAVEDTAVAVESHEETAAPVESTPEAATESHETVEETPEWFMKDKYKSVEEQAKSAFELQKKMGKFWGSPQDNYNVEGMEGIQSDDPLIANLMPALKEMGVSQDGFKHLVEKYMDANVVMAKALEEDLKKTLTTTDAHTYNSVDKWMNENLEPSEREQVKNNWLMSSADFKLFNHLRLMAAPSTSVPNKASTASFESSVEVTNEKIKYLKEVKTGHRVADKNFKNTLDARFRDAVAREIRNKPR